MPPKSRRGCIAVARKAPETRGRVGRTQAAAEEAPPVKEMREAPAEEMRVAEEAPKVVEELNRQPSPPPPSQQPAVEEKGSDGTANGASHAEECSMDLVGHMRCLLVKTPALAKMSFEQHDLNGDISDLTPMELSSLNDWEYKFTSKYVKVGSIRSLLCYTEGTFQSGFPMQ